MASIKIHELSHDNLFGQEDRSFLNEVDDIDAQIVFGGVFSGYRSRRTLNNFWNPTRTSDDGFSNMRSSDVIQLFQMFVDSLITMRRMDYIYQLGSSFRNLNFE